MTSAKVPEQDQTYPVRVTVRMTGLKAELLRAWETRHNAVQPLRTVGGSRRYSHADVHRLTLLRELVDTGHRIGSIARLDLAALEALLLEAKPECGSSTLGELIACAKAMNADDAQRLISRLIEEQGACGFARDIALPLLVEIGERWRSGDLSISVEHFMTGIIRSALISAVGAYKTSASAPKMIFSTPSKEPHDIGSLVAALVAAEAGAHVIFLGAGVPVADLVGAVSRSRAEVLVLGFVTIAAIESNPVIREARAGVSRGVGVWMGGAGIRGIPPIKDTLRIENLEQLEAQVLQLVASGEELTAAERTRAES